MERKLLVKDINKLVAQRNEFNALASNCSKVLHNKCWHPKAYREETLWQNISDEYDAYHWYRKRTTCKACHKTLIIETRGQDGQNYRKEVLEKV
jgi:hypothetical protein